MDQLLARAQAAQVAPQSGQQALLGAAEVERVVQRLRAFPLEEYGTPAWFAQHDQLQALNMQAHANAQARGEEYVKEALVSHGAVPALVAELLAAEAWRERLLPHLRPHLARCVDSVASYQLLFHEAVASNLLEVVLFHPEAAEAAGEEAALELADWCARRLAYLATDAREDAKYRERSARELLAQTPEDELREREAETRFGAAACALTLLRYLSDHAATNRLSLSALTRIASTNDTVMALLPLLERPPWERRGRSGQLERYSGSAWEPVPAAERARLPLLEAQCWLALNNLLVDPGARAKLDLTAARCDALFKLKERFSELLFDQLPVLRDLQRVIDELALGVNTAATAPQPAPGSKLIVEAVPQLRARLLGRRSEADWEAMAEAARRGQFGAATAALSRQRLEAMLRGFDFMADLEGGSGSTGGREGADGSGPPRSVKVDAYRRVKEGVWEWWATYSLDINADRPPERVSSGGGSTAGSRAAAKQNENQPQQPGAGEGSSADAKGSSGGKAAAAATGLRYRLRPLAEGLQRALPCDGKLAVLYGGRSCEALLSLPAAETRDGLAALPPAVWVTVGGLAGPGLALQLRLKRLERPSERDKGAGVWHAYVPVGGGLAVREGLLESSGSD